MTVRDRRLAGPVPGRGQLAGLEDDYLGPDRQVVMVVTGAADAEVHATVRRPGEAAAVKAIPPAAKNTAYGIGSAYSVLR
jgi:hypothetical protein